MWLVYFDFAGSQSPGQPTTYHLLPLSLLLLLGAPLLELAAGRRCRLGFNRIAFRHVGVPGAT